jgi:actin
MKVAVNTAKLLRNVPLPDEIATVHDNAVVIDFGTGSTRIGFSGDDAPRFEAPTVVSDTPDGTECFDKAYNKRETFKVRRVMERGIVKDWDGMECLLKYIYDLLQLSNDPNAPVLITEAALVPKEQRETMCELLFEKIGVQSVYFSSAPVLSLYSTGRTTGMVVDMGHGSCSTVPVYEGFGLFHTILQLDYGGHRLTEALLDQIHRTGVKLNPAHEYEVAQFLKEKYCVTLPDKGAYTMHIAEANRADQVQHELPDGTIVTLGTDRYRPTEALFDPSILGFTVDASGQPMRGLHYLAAESVRKCDQDIAPLMLSNIVLAGGTSLFGGPYAVGHSASGMGESQFNGLPDRLNREVQELVPSEKVRVHATTERKHAAWVGGSIFASLPTVQDMWVKKEDYDDITPPEAKKTIGHRNCF